ncbi:MAG: ParA family protein, partial [Bacillota bacterium]
MAVAVSVINYKGGVGKTTLAANLGAYLAAQGKRVLLIDLDPQGSLTFSFVSEDEWRDLYKDRKTVRLWFDRYIYDRAGTAFQDLIIQPPAVAERLAAQASRTRGTGRLDLICSDLGLINVDLELAPRLSSGSATQAAHNFLKVHSLLQEGIRSLPPDRYDFVLMDCPPNFYIVTKNALVASDHYLVPVRPDYLSTIGLDELERHVAQLVEEYNGYLGRVPAARLGPNEPGWQPIRPKLLGVVLTMVQLYRDQPIGVQEHYIRRLQEKGVPVFETRIRDNTSLFAEAPQWGVPVVLTQAHNPSQELAREELETLTQEFVQWL